MQFKHPEILYALFALLIPIFIHLFQLQRFTKIPFTNVSFLKEIELQTRKSSRLKKWLVLITRLLAFAAIIIAFAQPYFSKNDSSKEWFTTLYLDNSLSMQAKGEQGELLKRAIHDLVISLPDKGKYTLLTNNEIFEELANDELKEILKNISYAPRPADLNAILIKSQQQLDKHTTQHQKLILVSDFQQASGKNQIEYVKNKLLDVKTKFDFIQLKPKHTSNISIDSVYAIQNNLDVNTLSVILKNQGQEVDNISLSAIQDEGILAKTTVSIAADTSKEINLQIPESSINSSLKLDSKDSYTFDNEFFISMPKKDKIKVLLLTESNSFLERIYTKPDFDLQKFSKNKIGFDKISKQDLIVLEGLKNTNSNLQNSLSQFVKNAGSLVFLPTVNDPIQEVNSLFQKFNLGQITKKTRDSLYITKIHFAHPLLENVFEKAVHNFQYPYVSSYFEGNLNQSTSILSFENQEPFLSQFTKDTGLIYWVAAPITTKVSNFTNAPLVVPIFYNIGKQSVHHKQLSYKIGLENQIAIPLKLQKDAVLHITNSQIDFIPRQEMRADKVVLFTNNQPQVAGFYSVQNETKSVYNLAYNYAKDESLLAFYNMSEISKKNAAIKEFKNIKQALSALSESQSSTSYFKWFVLVALLFLLIEILLLKYL